MLRTRAVVWGSQRRGHKCKIRKRDTKKKIPNQNLTGNRQQSYTWRPAANQKAEDKIPKKHSKRSHRRKSTKKTQGSYFLYAIHLHLLLIFMDSCFKHAHICCWVYKNHKEHDKEAGDVFFVFDLVFKCVWLRHEIWSQWDFLVK